LQPGIEYIEIRVVAIRNKDKTPGNLGIFLGLSWRAHIRLVTASDTKTEKEKKNNPTGTHESREKN